MRMAVLVCNWWIMAIRGGLAIAFGFAVALWPNVTLGIVVTLFGVYAILDGIWAVAAAARTSLSGAWPVTLEGCVGIALGGLALVWPFVPLQVVYVLAAWGVLTGGLELIAAAGLPRRSAGHWLLTTGGLCSLFLAGLIMLLPHADMGVVVRIIGVYAQVFGIVLLGAALAFRQGQGAARVGAARRP